MSDPTGYTDPGSCVTPMLCDNDVITGYKRITLANVLRHANIERTDVSINFAPFGLRVRHTECTTHRDVAPLNGTPMMNNAISALIDMHESLKRYRTALMQVCGALNELVHCKTKSHTHYCKRTGVVRMTLPDKHEAASISMSRLVIIQKIVNISSVKFVTTSSGVPYIEFCVGSSHNEVRYRWLQ